MQQEAQKQGNKKSTPPPNAVATKKENAVAIPAEFAQGGWDTEVVDTKDILVPKILLMHPTSDLVKKAVKEMGQIIKSTTEETIAKRNETFDVIVFEKWKEWRIMKKNPQSGRYEFVRTEAWTTENDDLPWDYEENGDTLRRDKTMNFYGILSKEAQAGTAFPVKLSFTRTGFRTGLKIADAYTRAIMNKQPPINQSFKIGAELKEGKEETFFAFTASPGAETTEEQRKVALQWRQIIMAGKKNNTIADHDVDDEPETSNAKSSAANTTEF